MPHTGLKSKTPLPLHRVATALPFINYLQQQGVQLEPELRRARLPVLAMYDPDCFIPSRNYWNFIANIAEHEGINDLGFHVGLQSGASAVDQGLAKQLVRLPTLHQALDLLCKIASTEISQVHLWLEPVDRNTHCLHYRTSFGPEHQAYEQFQWYGLVVMIVAIRLFAGAHWQPRQIGLGSARKPGRTISHYFSDTLFRTAQEHCSINISGQLLGKPPHLDEDLFESSPHYSRIKTPRDFIGALKLALRSYLRDGAPSLELAAEITCLSTRTLQRQLTDEGLSYRDLLAEVRYETAIELMQNTEQSISDIANLCGYSDPTHFSRAFRRIAGISPHEYIQLYPDY